MPEREKADPKQSKSVQDFLKAIYTLQQADERVATNALAEELAVAAPSVTDMAQRLVIAGLVDYERYKGVRLTAAGEAEALKIIRRHRLIELYLVSELNYELREVHEEAENLEHAVSERFIEALADKLGNPELDPHGDPIPAVDGSMIRRDLRPLTEWPLHQAAAVSRIKTDNQELLQHILDKGFKLNTHVEVLARDPFEGPLTAMVDGKMRIIGFQVAACIMVEANE